MKQTTSSSEWAKRRQWLAVCFGAIAIAAASSGGAIVPGASLALWVLAVAVWARYAQLFFRHRSEA